MARYENMSSLLGFKQSGKLTSRIGNEVTMIESIVNVSRHQKMMNRSVYRTRTRKKKVSDEKHKKEFAEGKRMKDVSFL